MLSYLSHKNLWQLFFFSFSFDECENCEQNSVISRFPAKLLVNSLMKEKLITSVIHEPRFAFVSVYFRVEGKTFTQQELRFKYVTVNSFPRTDGKVV